MTRRVLPPPFQQGALDSLCGPYSLVNAVRYLRSPFPHAEGVRLLKRLLRRLEPQRPLVRRMTYGTDQTEMEEVLQAVLVSRYGMGYSRPFKGQRVLTLETYLGQLERFLCETQGIVLISLEGVYNHWTLVRQVTPKSLLLYDSDRLTRLSRRTCVLKAGDDRRRWHVIKASYTFFLWVE